MTQFIGQITVILDSASPLTAEDRLRSLAQQLQDSEDDVVFADHNGDVEDVDALDAECLTTPPEVVRVPSSKLIAMFLDEIESTDEPSFTAQQLDFLERRFAEIRFALSTNVSPCRG